MTAGISEIIKCYPRPRYYALRLRAICFNTTSPRRRSGIDNHGALTICLQAGGNPVSVNNRFFEVCTPGTKGSKTFACAKGTKELEGTGFWDPSRPTENGATSWLETKAPVVPGETITIQFMIWDTGDHILDSTVLLDNFVWDAAPTTGPVTDRPK